MNDVIGTTFATAAPSPSMRTSSRPLSIIRESPNDEFRRASFHGNEIAAKSEENNESDRLLRDDLSRSDPESIHDDCSRTLASHTDNGILKPDASSRTNDLPRSDAFSKTSDLSKSDVSPMNSDLSRPATSSRTGGLSRSKLSSKTSDLSRSNTSSKTSDLSGSNTSSKTSDLSRSNTSSKTSDLSRSNTSSRGKHQPKSHTSLKSNDLSRSDHRPLRKKDDLPEQKSLPPESSTPQRHLRRMAVAPLQHPLYSLSKGSHSRYQELPGDMEETQTKDSSAEGGYVLPRRTDVSKDVGKWARKSAVFPSMLSSTLSSSLSSSSSLFKSMKSQRSEWGDNSEAEHEWSYERHKVDNDRECSTSVLKNSRPCRDEARNADEEDEDEKRTEEAENSEGENVNSTSEFHSYVDDQFCDVESDTDDNRFSDFFPGPYRDDSISGQVSGDAVSLSSLSDSFSRKQKGGIDSEQYEWIERVKKSSRFKDVHEGKFDYLRRTVSINDAENLLPCYSFGYNFISLPPATNSDPSATVRSNVRSMSVCDFSAFGRGREKRRNSSLADHSAVAVTVGPDSQTELMQKLIEVIYSKTGNTTHPVGLATERGSNAEAEAQSTDASTKPQEPPRRISTIDQSAFSLLKATTSRLRLPTRRASTAAWRAMYMDNPAHQLPVANKGGEERRVDKMKDPPLTPERKSKIDESLSWLKHELINIRLQDQALARQFLNIRQTMNTIRLNVECEGHQDLLDTAEEDMEELRELSQVVDVPTELLSPFSPLKQIGITRMNISSRRFSTC